jgi:hypothetical protein
MSFTRGASGIVRLVKAPFTKQQPRWVRAEGSVRIPPHGREPELGRPAITAIGRPFLFVLRRLVFSGAGGTAKGAFMLSFIAKAAFAGLMVALVATVARRYPGWGGLLASLPLVSVLSMVLLYGETRDTESVARLSLAAFWFFLPSMPMFLIIPAMLRSDIGFTLTMIVACAVTVLLYAAMNWLAPRFGIAL